jgi:hypothetical protein
MMLLSPDCLCAPALATADCYGSCICVFVPSAETLAFLLFFAFS